MDNGRHAGTVALVTGAASGIGRAAAEARGAVRTLANVAGIMEHFVPAGEVDDALWDDVPAINLTAPMRLCRRVLPLMARCNAVCPGDVATNIGTTAQPTVQWAFDRQLLAIALSERKAGPDEIAAAISWLASAETSNVNGVALPVEGGWKAA